MRRAAGLVVVFWVASLVVLLPQLGIQRLDPLLVVVVHQPSGSGSGSGSVGGNYSAAAAAEASVQLVHVCVEYFADYRWNVAYTLGFYVAVCIVPVRCGVA